MIQPAPSRPTSRGVILSRLVLGLLAVLVTAATRADSAAAGNAAAGAGTPVSVVQARAASGYQVTRRYAGDLVARQTAKLGFEQAGRIAVAHADLGDRVQAGDLLLTLDDSMLAAALSRAKAGVAQGQARLRQAAAALALQELTQRRIADLVRKGHASAQDGDREDLNLDASRAAVAVAEADLAGAMANRDSAEAAYAQTRLLAPFAGVIQARHVDPGQVVRPGDPVLELVSSSQPEVHVGVPTGRAATLPANARVTLEIQHLPGATLAGTLRHVLPASDPITRTRTAIIDPDTAHAGAISLDPTSLAPGTLVELLLTEQVASAGFWLPLTSLTEATRGLWAVFVVNSSGQAERHLVDVLHSESDRVFVRGTLHDGDRVVSGGTQRIVAGQNLEVVRTLDPYSA